MNPSHIPAWHRGQPVRSEDLLRWEEYLLSRHSFEGVDPGIESLSAASIATGGVNITVRNLRGLAASGHPVILEGEAYLQTTAPPQGQMFDLFIQVHAARWRVAAPPPEKPAGKYELLALHAEQGTPAPALHEYGHHLYLGRWSRHEMQLTSHLLPRPRRLMALLPLLGLSERSLSLKAWLGDVVGRIHTAEEGLLKTRLLTEGHRLLISDLLLTCQRLAHGPDTLENPWAPEPPSYTSHAADGLPACLRELMVGMVPVSPTLLQRNTHYTLAANKLGGQIEFTSLHQGDAVLRMKTPERPKVYYVNGSGMGLSPTPESPKNGWWELTPTHGENSFRHAWEIHPHPGPDNIEIHCRPHAQANN